ncbi:MAG: Arm DNA-binding domain-containing protein [Gillisia sp.]
MNILFLIQNSKLNKRGTTPIRFRITIDKSRKEFSTGIFVNPEYWSKEKQKVFDPGENSETVNSQISLIKQKLSRAFLMLQIQGVSFDVDDVYKIYCGVDKF